MLDKREALAKIREHFSQPDARLAFDPSYVNEYGGRCVYRADGDPSSTVRCAFGVLIPDDRYKPAMEGRAAFDVAATHLADLFPTVEGYGDTDAEFLNAVQSAHDDVATDGGTVEEFLANLDEVARKWGVE